MINYCSTSLQESTRDRGCFLQRSPVSAVTGAGLGAPIFRGNALVRSLRVSERDNKRKIPVFYIIAPSRPSILVFLNEYCARQKTASLLAARKGKFSAAIRRFPIAICLSMGRIKVAISIWLGNEEISFIITVRYLPPFSEGNSNPSRPSLGWPDLFFSVQLRSNHALGQDSLCSASFDNRQDSKNVV